VAFGHNETDALCSLIKSAIMYMDSRENGYERFDKERFRRLALKWKRAILCGDECKSMIKVIQGFVRIGAAGTDEAPKSRLQSCVSIEIVRPMFFVQEEILRTCARDYIDKVEGSGCGHGASASTRTPREIVQWEMLDPIIKSDVGDLFLKEMREILQSSIMKDGCAKVDVRKERCNILGTNYKSTSGEKL